jgi:hypothetical protein
MFVHPSCQCFGVLFEEIFENKLHKLLGITIHVTEI